MGMTIEELVAENDKLKRQLAYESTALTMMQADYNARLKADLWAMLVRLKNEIDDLRACDDIETVDKCEEIIQEKINSLKGEQGT